MGGKFVAVYQRRNVTPYIHALMNHVGEFMRVHGSIIPFTQQGLEKKNDIITKTYFRSSNHQGEAALRQIIEKQNRIEHMETLGVKKVKVHDALIAMVLVIIDLLVQKHASIVRLYHTVTIWSVQILTKTKSHYVRKKIDNSTCIY